MSSQIPRPRAGSAAELRHSLWQPTLVRGLVALVFGAVTIFWQEPTEAAAPWATAGFLVATGLACVYLQAVLNKDPADTLGTSRNVPRSYAVLYILGGALIAVTGHTQWLFVLVTAVVLGVCGLTELLLGLRFRRTHPLGRDWTLCGAVTVLAGAGMMLVESLGAKAELGVLGGAAIVIGVTQVIAALSLRHDGRGDGRRDGRDDGRPGPDARAQGNRVD